MRSCESITDEINVLFTTFRGSFTAIVDMLIKAEREKINKDKVARMKEHAVSSETNSLTSYKIYETEYETDFECNSENYTKQVRDLLWNLARNHLDAHDWKRLARHWNFTEEQIKAIEHQYTGKTSYKDHW